VVISLDFTDDIHYFGWRLGVTNCVGRLSCVRSFGIYDPTRNGYTDVTPRVALPLGVRISDSLVRDVRGVNIKPGALEYLSNFTSRSSPRGIGSATGTQRFATVTC
jgi:hypothetical protein